MTGRGLSLARTGPAGSGLSYPGPATKRSHIGACRRRALAATVSAHVALERGRRRREGRGARRCGACTRLRWPDTRWAGQQSYTRAWTGRNQSEGARAQPRRKRRRRRVRFGHTARRASARVRACDCSREVREGALVWPPYPRRGGRVMCPCAKGLQTP